MDRSQIIAFVDYMLGYREVGVAEGEVFQNPTSPEVKAFVVARLGDKTPGPAWRLSSPSQKEASLAMANFLREVADGLDALHPENPT